MPQVLQHLLAILDDSMVRAAGNINHSPDAARVVLESLVIKALVCRIYIHQRPNYLQRRLKKR